MRLGGVILCGGKSTRMGQSKAMLPFGGMTLLECVVQRLVLATPQIVVVAAVNQNLPNLPSSCVIVRDESPERGPLEGLRVGLAALEPTCDAAYATGCDTPFLVPAIVTYLANHLGNAQIVVPVEEGRLHPLAAIYRTSLSQLAAQLLNQGESRLQSLLESASTRRIDAQWLRALDLDLLTLRNLNAPEDYQRALETENTIIIPK